MTEAVSVCAGEIWAIVRRLGIQIKVSKGRTLSRRVLGCMRTNMCTNMRANMRTNIRVNMRAHMRAHMRANMRANIPTLLAPLRYWPHYATDPLTLLPLPGRPCGAAPSRGGGG